MLLTLDPDQEFFRDTTARFLAEHVPVGTLRRLRDDPAGFGEGYWQRGAELGWTSLLVPEALGGGTIGEHGIVDLTLVAHEFGQHAAPGPLCPTNLVATALSEYSDADNAELLARLIAGTATAAWCFGQPIEASRDSSDVVLRGTARPVESASRAEVVLVTGTGEAGPTQVLVPTTARGVTIRPMHTVDMTRRFDVVTFENVRVNADAVLGDLGGAGPDFERQLQLALVVTNAETVGAMQAAFDMTVEWAFDRYSFGRPLASYQELKHRFADMKSWLEASHAISDDAAAAVASGAGEATELVRVAKAFIGQYGAELVQDCVQLHGGIGVTFEHNLHLFLRRVTLNRALYGTPAVHRQRIAELFAGGRVAA